MRARRANTGLRIRFAYDRVLLDFMSSSQAQATQQDVYPKDDVPIWACCTSKPKTPNHQPQTAASLQVYDLSEFMDRHPGGPTTILAWAGKDASKFFNDIHKGVKMLGWEFRVLRVLRGLGFKGVKMLGWEFRVLRVLRGLGFKGVKMLGWEFRVLRVLRGLGFQGVKMLGWGFRVLRVLRGLGFKGVKMLGWQFRVLRVLRGLGFQGVKMLGWGFRGLRCRGFIKIGDPDRRTKQSE